MLNPADTESDKHVRSFSSRMSPSDRPARHATLSFTPRRVACFFLGLVVMVVIVGTIANYCIFHVASSPESNGAKVLRRFDLGHEPSIPNMYSSVALLCSAALLALIGRLEHRSRQTGWIYWYGLAIVFIGLGIDEAVLFHEMIDAAIKNFIDTSGFLYLPWVVVGGIFALVFAIIFIPFVARKSKRTLWLFILAGAVFISGAIGMEIVASVIFENSGSEELGKQTISHTIAQSIEELCEMLGIVLFIYALIDYLAARFATIEIRFSPVETRES